MPGRLRAEEGGSDEPVVGHPDAAQRRLAGHHGRLGGLAGPDSVATGRLRAATAIGRRGVASPVVWRPPLCAPPSRWPALSWPSSPPSYEDAHTTGSRTA